MQKGQRVSFILVYDSSGRSGALKPPSPESRAAFKWACQNKLGGGAA